MSNQFHSGRRSNSIPPEEDELFTKGFPKLEFCSYAEHVVDHVLIDYVYEELRPPELSRVAAHVATCELCTTKVQTLREEFEKVEARLSKHLTTIEMQREEKQMRTIGVSLQALGQQLQRAVLNFVEPWRVGKRGFYWHAVAYVGVGAVLVLLNIRINETKPHFVGTASDKIWWSLWIMIAWSLFVIWHAWRTWRRH